MNDNYPHSHSEPIAFDSLEGVIIAIMTMDVGSLERTILAGVLYSPDMSCYSLLSQLTKQISYLRSTGNVRLKPLNGKCVGACEMGNGFSFEGDHTGHRLNYIIKKISRERIEIQKCICFQVNGEPIPDPF